MDTFLNALRSGIHKKNWHAALFIALALPDICGKMEDPDGKSGPRYRSWFQRYVEPKYTNWVGPRDTGHEHKFLSASDCYALRCAYLHEGADDITEQTAREALERFHFIKPSRRSILHCNQINQVLQLQVDIFFNDIIAGVEQWLADTKIDNNIQKRLDSLITIRSID